MILYHYCSNHAFQSMVSKREIWLSSLSLSNDSMEGKWLREIFREICADEKLDADATKKVTESIERLESMIDGLGFCLSERGDMLSQWRGYASDAAGICIGFSKAYLEELSVASKMPEVTGFTLDQVEYVVERQKPIIQPTYRKVKEFIDKGAFRFSGRRMLLDSRTDEEVETDKKQQEKAFHELSLALLGLFPELFRLKNPAFEEEREWRLISHLIHSGTDKCEFRGSIDRIIPYRVFGIPENKNDSLVEVILGPKNITPIIAVEAFLKQHNFLGVKVRKSTATYR